MPRLADDAQRGEASSWWVKDDDAIVPLSSELAAQTSVTFYWPQYELLVWKFFATGRSTSVVQLAYTQCMLFAEQPHPMYAIVVLLLVIVTISSVQLQQFCLSDTIHSENNQTFWGYMASATQHYHTSNQSQISIYKLLLSI